MKEHKRATRLELVAKAKEEMNSLEKALESVKMPRKIARLMEQMVNELFEFSNMLDEMTDSDFLASDYQSELDTIIFG